MSILNDWKKHFASTYPIPTGSIGAGPLPPFIVATQLDKNFLNDLFQRKEVPATIMRNSPCYVWQDIGNFVDSMKRLEKVRYNSSGIIDIDEAQSAMIGANKIRTTTNIVTTLIPVFNPDQALLSNATFYTYIMPTDRDTIHPTYGKIVAYGLFGPYVGSVSPLR